MLRHCVQHVAYFANIAAFQDVFSLRSDASGKMFTVISQTGIIRARSPPFVGPKGYIFAAGTEQACNWPQAHENKNDPYIIPFTNHVAGDIADNIRVIRAFCGGWRARSMLRRKSAL